MKRLIFAAVALVFLVAAAQPADVAPIHEAQGFFIEDGSDADPDAVEDAVAAARFEGGRLSIAVLAVEPPGGATIYAENTLDAMGGNISQTAKTLGISRHTIMRKLEKWGKSTNDS